MEVILLDKVENLGNIGDRVKVRSGYGRNYLLPKGKATLATAENIAIFEERRAELELKQTDERAASQARGEQLGHHAHAGFANAVLAVVLCGGVRTQ